MSYWDVQNGSHLESTAQRGEAMRTFLLARFKDLDLGNVTIGLEIDILTTPTFREEETFLLPCQTLNASLPWKRKKC